MTKKALGVAALSTLAISLLSGCANIQDQIAKKVAEGVVNQATGGKLNMSGNGSNLTIKDNQGNVAQIGGGDQRPASVPADMPSLPGASAFGWFGGKDGGIFTFNVASGDYKTACDQMITLVKAAGWTESANGFNMEFQGSKTVVYEKKGFTLSLTCATSDNKATNVTLSKTASDNAGSTTATSPAPADSGASSTGTTTTGSN